MNEPTWPDDCPRALVLGEEVLRMYLLGNDLIHELQVIPLTERELRRGLIDRLVEVTLWSQALTKEVLALKKQLHDDTQSTEQRH